MMDNVTRGYSNRYKVLPYPEFYKELYVNDPFSSLYSNFIIDEKEKEKKIKNLYSKISGCGLNEVELLNKYSGDCITHVIYCNNRSCSNPECMKHRGYLFNREHGEQITKIDANIRNAKAWIFTGWKVSLDRLDRRFCQEKLKLVNRLCNEHSVSAYSVHMEIKVYPRRNKDGSRNKNSWWAYLHFHVCSGGFRNLKVMQKRYGRIIKYEKAIKRNQLNFYMSKYASKTPFFDSEFKRQYYHLLVYKLQMHRFSEKKDRSLESRESDFILMDEIRSCLYRDSYKNPMSSKKLYFEFLENQPPPYMGGNV